MPESPRRPLATAAQIAEIERIGLRYHEEPQYDLSRLSVERRIQVREDANYAGKDEIGRYAVQMGQSTFPPIVVTEDDWLDDGNTRVGAALQRGDKFFPAIVLEVSWERAAEKVQHELKALAATLNQQNGRALTKREQRIVTEDLLSLGWKQEQIERAAGVKAAVIFAVKQEMDARARMQRVGLIRTTDMSEIDEKFPDVAIRALGRPKVLGLNNEPYKHLVELTRDAGLNMNEISEIAKEADETGSDAGALAKLTEVREEMADRIRQKALTGQGKPPASRMLRQRLGFVTKYLTDDFKDELPSLVETNPQVAQQHLDAIDKTISVLQQLRAMQLESVPPLLEDDGASERAEAA